MAAAGQLRIVASNKVGGRKLLFQGFSYVEKSSSNVSVFWACSEKAMYSCKGTLKTNIDLTNQQVGLLKTLLFNLEK